MVCFVCWCLWFLVFDVACVLCICVIVLVYFYIVVIYWIGGLLFSLFVFVRFSLFFWCCLGCVALGAALRFDGFSDCVWI